MPLPEATKLLTRHQWREGDLLLLEGVAARLGLQVPGLDPWRREHVLRAITAGRQAALSAGRDCLREPARRPVLCLPRRRHRLHKGRARVPLDAGRAHRCPACRSAPPARSRRFPTCGSMGGGCRTTCAPARSSEGDHFRPLHPYRLRHQAAIPRGVEWREGSNASSRVEEGVGEDASRLRIMACVTMCAPSPAATFRHGWLRVAGAPADAPSQKPVMALFDQFTPTPRNRLLGALPPKDLVWLRSCLERVEVPARHTPYAAGEPITAVYF